MESMIKSVIVDDEENGRSNLKEVLKRYCPDVFILSEAASAQEGALIVTQKQPDLVFLDIEMPGGSGFEMLRLLKSREFEVIFITAYDQYGIQAIKFSAIDYILKPINYLDLIEAVNKVQKRLFEKKGNKRLLNLVQNMESAQNDKRLALPTQNSVEFIEVNSIIRCQADNNYTEFHLLGDRKLLVCKTLKEYEEILTDFGFFRPHQSHLINMRYLMSYIKSDGGTLVMRDEVHIPVSRFKKNELKAYLLKF